MQTCKRTLTTVAAPLSVSQRERSHMMHVRTWFNLLRAASQREEGQTMAEYGVVLAVITIAVFGALALLAGNITNALTRVAGYIT